MSDCKTSFPNSPRGIPLGRMIDSSVPIAATLAAVSVVVVQQHFDGPTSSACVDAVGALTEQIAGKQPLTVLARHDLLRRGLALWNGQRRADIVDSHIEIEFIEACLDLDAARRITHHFEYLNHAEDRPADHVPPRCPAPTLLRQELFHSFAIDTAGRELNGHLLAHADTHDQVQYDGADRAEHQRVSEDWLQN